MDSTLVVLTGYGLSFSCHPPLTINQVLGSPLISVSFSLPSLYSLTSPTFTQLMWVRVRV